MCFLSSRPSIFFSSLRSRSLASVLSLNGPKWAESKESFCGLCFSQALSPLSLSFSLFLSLSCVSLITFSQKQNTAFFLPTGPLKYFTRLEGFMPSPPLVCVCRVCLVAKLYEGQCNGNTKRDLHHSEKLNYEILADM